MRSNIKDLVNHSDSKAGRWFEVAIQVLVLISLVEYSISTLRGLPTTAMAVLEAIELVVVGVFTVEYLLRLYAADDRLRFVFSFYGIVDLVAILPFYAGLGSDLRTLRTLRLLRVFRVLKFARYTRAVEHLKQALLSVKEEIAVYLVATGIVIFLASVAIHYFEAEAQPEAFGSVFHCAWWAVVTLTTVGYGDVYPVTVGGRLFTSVLLIAALGLIAIPSGIVASALMGTPRSAGGTERGGESAVPREEPRPDGGAAT